MTEYTLTPHDLTFLMNECPRCFALNAKGILKRPYNRMPIIFFTTNNSWKNVLRKDDNWNNVENAPKGNIVQIDAFVEGVLGSSKSYDVKLKFNGKIDIVVKKEDGTYAFVKVMSSTLNDEDIQKQYALAMNAIATAAKENFNVTSLGVFVFKPYHVEFPNQSLKGNIRYVDIEKDDAFFAQEMVDIAGFLAGDTPDFYEDCEFCKYTQNILNAQP